MQCTMLWARFGENIVRALPMCMSHASMVLSKHEVGVEPRFCLFSGTAAVLAQGGGGGRSPPSALSTHRVWECGPSLHGGATCATQ